MGEVARNIEVDPVFLPNGQAVDFLLQRRQGGVAGGDRRLCEVPRHWGNARGVDGPRRGGRPVGKGVVENPVRHQLGDPVDVDGLNDRLGGHRGGAQGLDEDAVGRGPGCSGEQDLGFPGGRDVGGNDVGRPRLVAQRVAHPGRGAVLRDVVQRVDKPVFDPGDDVELDLGLPKVQIRNGRDGNERRRPYRGARAYDAQGPVGKP